MKVVLHLLAQADARTKFIESIIEAKAAGVDVDSCFLALHNQIILAWVRCFGLSMGVLFVCTSPYIPPIFQVICFKLGMPYHLSEIYYYWPFLIGILAIISFGFNLVDPRTLRRITGKPTFAEPADSLSASGHFPPVNMNDSSEGDD